MCGQWMLGHNSCFPFSPSSHACYVDSRPLAMQDPGTWAILEHFLTTDLTYSNMEDEFSAYLSNCHHLLEWMDARMAIWLGKDNDQVSLHIPENDDIEEPPPCIPKIHCLKISEKEDQDQDQDEIQVVDIPLYPVTDQGDNEEDKLEDKLEIKDGAPNCTRVTPLPVPKHTLTNAIHGIKQSYQMGSGSMICQPSTTDTPNCPPSHKKNNGKNLCIHGECWTLDGEKWCCAMGDQLCCLVPGCVRPVEKTVSSVDFLGAKLTIDTDRGQQITVPI
ncbi:hypothetical protein BDR04DRAFT_1117521 [Suillus decipiens]|nr:hypothetical protein BDR04DRAFT_1117521 [Suillus decipiens]